jgi:DNA-binding XRE family transcriptional regulator
MRRADLNLIAEARHRANTGLARQLRQRNHLSQAKVATAVGVTRSAVAQWETGRALPAGKHALAYARLLRELANWTVERSP